MKGLPPQLMNVISTLNNSRKTGHHYKAQMETNMPCMHCIEYLYLLRKYVSSLYQTHIHLTILKITSVQMHISCASHNFPQCHPKEARLLWCLDSFHWALSPAQVLSTGDINSPQEMYIADNESTFHVSYHIN